MKDLKAVLCFFVAIPWAVFWSLNNALFVFVYTLSMMPYTCLKIGVFPWQLNGGVSVVGGDED